MSPCNEDRHREEEARRAHYHHHRAIEHILESLLAGRLTTAQAAALYEQAKLVYAEDERTR